MSIDEAPAGASLLANPPPYSYNPWSEAYANLAQEGLNPAAEYLTGFAELSGVDASNFD